MYRFIAKDLINHEMVVFTSFIIPREKDSNWLVENSYK